MHRERKMLKILLVEDHGLVRHAVRAAVEQDTNFKVVAAVSNAKDALKLLRKTPDEFDLAIVDYDLGHDSISGIQLVGMMRSIGNLSDVLMLSGYQSLTIAAKAIAGGAKGFLTKQRCWDEIIKALYLIRRGGFYMDQSIQEIGALNKVRTVKKNKLESLTPTEMEILLKICKGKDLRAISEAMHLDIRTVRYYRQNILKKLSLENDVMLLHYAIENKLVDVDLI